jgi:hypothetical protein
MPRFLSLLLRGVKMDPVETGFKFAYDLAKELITLATGILALSITFTKDILKSLPKATWLLKSAWMAYLLSILFGICTMMALTGRLMPTTPLPPGEQSTFGASVRVFAGLQIIAFLTGTILIIGYGANSLNKGKEPESEKSSDKVPSN